MRVIKNPADMRKSFSFPLNVSQRCSHHTKDAVAHLATEKPFALGKLFAVFVLHFILKFSVVLSMCGLLEDQTKYYVGRLMNSSLQQFLKGNKNSYMGSKIKFFLLTD